jgi:endonuclease G
MPFKGYLNINELKEVTLAAVESGLIDIDRSLRLQGISKPFALGLKRDSNPLDQFQLDLGTINDVERLDGGQVPLLQFLENSAYQLKLRSRKEADAFERLANRIGNRARGIPQLPEPTQLPEVTKKEAIIGIDDMVDFPFLAAGAEAGGSVARITVPRFEDGTAISNSNGSPWVMRGTAWVLGPQLLVTNHHVLNARRNEEGSAAASDFERQATESLVEFDYDTGRDPVRAKVESVVAFSEDLDYAAFRIGNEVQRPPLRLATKKIILEATSYLPVNIIQHPRGLQKRVAFRNNLVSRADNDTIRYFTDTDVGSSGSPVCDDSWQVVALHRGARYVEGVNFQGKSTAYVNFGTQVQAICEDLRLKDPSLYAGLIGAQDPH